MYLQTVKIIISYEGGERVNHAILMSSGAENIDFMIHGIVQYFAKVDTVLDYFIDCVKEYKNIGTAYVTSAMELSEAQKAAVEKRLLETTKYVKFEMHYAVDSALIGGMVIRIGDRVVDSSVRTKLNDLTRELSKIQLKASECAS